MEGGIVPRTIGPKQRAGAGEEDNGDKATRRHGDKTIRGQGDKVKDEREKTDKLVAAIRHSIRVFDAIR